MVKVSQRKTTVREKRSKISSRRRKEREYKSAASGKMEHKVWKPGEVQKNNVAADDQLQNQVWDPGRRG